MNYVVVVKRPCALCLTASPCSCSFSRRDYVNSNSNQGQTRHCAPIERSHGACYLKLILCLCLLLINKESRSSSTETSLVIALCFLYMRHNKTPTTNIFNTRTLSLFNRRYNFFFITGYKG